jgi:hypothetical protein
MQSVDFNVPEPESGSLLLVPPDGYRPPDGSDGDYMASVRRVWIRSYPGTREIVVDEFLTNFHLRNGNVWDQRGSQVNSLDDIKKLCHHEARMVRRAFNRQSSKFGIVLNKNVSVFGLKKCAEGVVLSLTMTKDLSAFVERDSPCGVLLLKGCDIKDIATSLHSNKILCGRDANYWMCYFSAATYGRNEVLSASVANLMI